MIVSTENQGVSADISLIDGALEIAFSDPSYVRADMILLHSSNSSLVAVHHEGYHHIHAVQNALDLSVMKDFTYVGLKSELPSGEILKLQAPFCVK